MWWPPQLTHVPTHNATVAARVARTIRGAPVLPSTRPPPPLLLAEPCHGAPARRPTAVGGAVAPRPARRCHAPRLVPV